MFVYCKEKCWCLLYVFLSCDKVGEAGDIVIVVLVNSSEI